MVPALSSTECASGIEIAAATSVSRKLSALIRQKSSERSPAPAPSRPR
ncbi:Uncharacterised protein [Mycobacteroides abscessus subsp. abscessus]|nr:Uncharacterised protein [Mycobacteroides abscessus subsp. abscessus]